MRATAERACLVNCCTIPRAPSSQPWSRSTRPSATRRGSPAGRSSSPCFCQLARAGSMREICNGATCESSCIWAWTPTSPRRRMLRTGTGLRRCGPGHPPSLAPLIALFSGRSTLPSFDAFQHILGGWILCLGWRTVTGALRASGTVGHRHSSASNVHVTLT